MFRKTKDNKRNTAPNKVIQLSDNIEVAFWYGSEKRNGPAFRWSLSRINPDNPDRSFRTMHPEHIGECIVALKELAVISSKVTKLPSGLREELSALAESLGSIEVADSLLVAEEGNGESDMFG
jgi:hypothetical protein